MLVSRRQQVQCLWGTLEPVDAVYNTNTTVTCTTPASRPGTTFINFVVLQGTHIVRDNIKKERD